VRIVPRIHPRRRQLTVIEKITALPPHAPERLEVFREHVNQLRPLLRPEQLPAFDRAVDNAIRIYQTRQTTRTDPPN
jgi:hypothetical protein